MNFARHLSIMVYSAMARGARTRTHARLSAVLFLTIGGAFAQYPGGGYPPGGYPPGGGYPGGGYPGQSPYPGSGRTGPGIPIPSKSKAPKADSNQPLPSFRGKLKQMDNKSITIELDDNRVLDFKRTAKTKFFRNGDELKTPEFATGDQLSVEGPQDSEGYLTAVNVYWEKAANAGGAKSGSKDSVPDLWKDDPTKATPDSAATPERATEVAPPPAKPDADDPGRPKLQRGKPADPSREHAAAVPEEPPAAPQQTAANHPPEAPVEGGRSAASLDRTDASSDEEDMRRLQRPMDPLIRKATEAALDFTERLPDYVCQEMMARYQSESTPANWQPLDVVSANVVYEKGKEDYRDLAINGKAVKKGMEELSGSWSTGEFGTLLIDLFSPSTAATFHYSRDSRIAGITAKEYTFEVVREHSHWTIHQASQTYDPAYKGAVWIDPATARVLRIEMQAHGFPDEFPTDHIESATDYQYIRLGDTKQYLLPVHSETLSCQRGTNFCSRNAIDFRNYHKYAGESTIQFGDIKDK